MTYVEDVVDFLRKCVLARKGITCGSYCLNLRWRCQEITDLELVIVAQVLKELFNVRTLVLERGEQKITSVRLVDEINCGKCNHRVECLLNERLDIRALE